MDPITIEPIDMTTDPKETTSTNVSATPETQPNTVPVQRKLTEIPVKDENTALNLMIGFLDVAQKRGSYSIDESAKIWECIQKFIPQQPPANP